MELDFVKKEKKSNLKRIIFLLFNIFFIVYAIFIINYFFLKAPLGNKTTTIHIQSGQTVNEIASSLEEKKIIRYKEIFTILVKVFNRDKKINSGDYKIEKNLPVWKVAWQISNNNHNTKPIKILLREGLTNEEIAIILADKISLFRKDLFLAETKQGYLFPDTYYIYALTSTEEIIELLTSNFNRQIDKIKKEIKENDRSFEEIIIMASVIEKEAKGNDDSGIISGILWKRFDLGMPLQVDASPITYERKGLPDYPICNPGINSIKAALNPIGSDYLYYIHDKTGQVHYSIDYSQHKKNINEYL